MPLSIKAKAIGIDSFSQVDGGTGNGSTSAFVLSQTPKAGSLKVYVNGMRDFDWTVNISTKTVTFNSPPANLQNLVFDYWRVS